MLSLVPRPPLFFFMRASKLRNETKQKPHPQIYKSSAQVLYSTCIFSLGSVSEARLMFSVQFLLWQLLCCVVLVSHLAAH